MTSLIPGVISDVMTGETISFDLVSFETSSIIKSVERGQFQRYTIYNEGTKAFLFKPNHHVPITIVGYIPAKMSSPNKKKSTLHGKYAFTIDSDSTGKIREEQARRIFRVVEGRGKHGNENESTIY